MSNLKLSQIAVSNTAPALTDELVGVKSGNTDNLYTLTQIAQTVAGALTANALTPQQFGAFGDGSSHPISSQDIANNPQWIGSYGVGMEWDAVATQECIYKCFATNSTPHNVVWNLGSPVNKRMYVPEGNYQINFTLVMAAIGFHVEWSARNNAFWNWTGTIVTSGNTHTSTTIDGLSPAILTKIALIPGTNIPVNTGSTRGPLFVQGSGILPGTSVVTVNVAGGSITLSQATTSSVSGGNILFTMPMFYCNSVAYGSFLNPTMQAQVQLPRAGFFDDITNLQPSLEWDQTFCALWVLNESVPPAGVIGTAQITIYDAVLSGNQLADCGISISPSGGAAEGATIQFVNPQISGFWMSAIQQGGSNVAANTLFNGDFIGNYYCGIQSLTGSLSAFDTTLEAQLNNLNFNPQVGQIQNNGADFLFGQGVGLGTPSEIVVVRSEASVLGYVIDQSVSFKNCSVLAADQNVWFANFPFTLGTVIFPTTNNTKIRTFICVDTGGINTWNTMVSSAVPEDTITDSSGASYTTNQWVGFTLFFRFGSSGFTSHFTGSITANTSNTVTVPGSQLSPNIASLYSIGGQTGGSSPNFDSVTTSAQSGAKVFGGGRGFTLTPGSNQVVTGETVHVGDYVVVPLGDLVGPSPLTTSNLGIVPPVVCPYIAKILSIAVNTPSPGLDTLTMSKPAGRYVTGGFGYWGGVTVSSTITDGSQGLTWMAIDYATVYRAELIDGFHISAGGIVSACDAVRNIHPQRTSGWFDGATVTLYDSGLGVPRTTIESGQQALRLSAALDATQVTLDLTPYIETSNYSQLTPTQSMTLNAPVPLKGASQEWTLIILTSGTSSFTITFGTNMLSTGTLVTGTTDSKRFMVKFISDGTDWIELSRSGPL